MYRETGLTCTRKWMVGTWFLWSWHLGYEITGRPCRPRRSTRRSLHAARGAVGSAYGWVTVNSSCSRWLFIPTPWKQDASGQEPGSRHRWDSASLPCSVYAVCVCASGSRVEHSDLGRAEEEVGEVSSRRTLFLELCGTVSGMSSWWLENICKTLCLGHAVSVQPVLCVASAGKCGWQHSSPFNWTDQQKQIRSLKDGPLFFYLNA